LQQHGSWEFQNAPCAIALLRSVMPALQWPEHGDERRQRSG